ncbi:MAG: rhodanese-like domain-containing protein [Actinomycetota bacterium]|nr:rhodanese-like domain-containing protein [Actinomycetota bacterium]
MGDIRQVPVTELPNDFTDDADRVLLDVREYDEWTAGHVRGALHIPLGDVPTRLGEIDLDAELLVVCHSSGRSMRVLQYLDQMGYEGSCVRGGMLAWVEHGKPIETPNAESQ